MKKIKILFLTTLASLSITTVYAKDCRQSVAEAVISAISDSAKVKSKPLLIGGGNMIKVTVGDATFAPTFIVHVYSTKTHFDNGQSEVTCSIESVVRQH